jgi:hypothetical protein
MHDGPAIRAGIWESGGMTLGHSPTQADIFRSTAAYCEGRVAPDSIYGLLHRECHRLFPDALFADLFTDVGRRSVPPMIVAVVMVLQRLEGLSDREAVERFSYDVRWKYAAGGLPFDHPGFSHTVLVDMRARLARSARPTRIFEVTRETALEAGLVGRRRVLDSTPLYDAVATMDTVTLLRSGIRGLLRAADEREDALCALLRRDDDYSTSAKPAIDWEDPAAREALIDALARDASALLAALEGQTLPPALGEAATLLATLLGQDLEEGDDGAFRIARRVAAERVISTVDPDARHGHKTSARSFDGYKGHVALDPDAELVTAVTVTAGNAGDAAAAAGLLAADLEGPDDEGAQDVLTVYGDAAYGSGELLGTLEAAGAEVRIKVQPPAAQGGRFSKADFTIDAEAGAVTCPAGRTAPLRRRRHGHEAVFGAACAACPLVARCTTDPRGRSIKVGPHEASLARARAARYDPAWLADYRATRPKVERKIGHLMRRRHGGRQARVRGRPKVAADFSLLAAAVNLARLAVLGLVGAGPGWAVRAT